MAPKAFPPLDHRIITAIKGKLATLNLFSALNIQFKHLKMGRKTYQIQYASASVLFT